MKFSLQLFSLIEFNYFFCKDILKIYFFIYGTNCGKACELLQIAMQIILFEIYFLRSKDTAAKIFSN